MQQSSSRAHENNKDQTSGHMSTSESIANTFEWLIIAFILAFTFRTFVMEAFTIPTGSMAETLKGAHFSLRCTQCGYRYDYNYSPVYYNRVSERAPNFDLPLKPGSPRCPSCGYHLPPGMKMAAKNGDRILVFKSIYQLFEPQRWDVVVFNNPTGPRLDYIKRMIALPGETLEIIDGDIYIDGQITRKPPKVQKELWMPVYDNNYRPVKPDEDRFNGHSWRQPFKNLAESKWGLDDENPMAFVLDSWPEKIHTIFYDTKIGNNFKTAYAYNNSRMYRYMPYSSDLMVQFSAKVESQAGGVGVNLSKYGTFYKAWYDFAGSMVISKQAGDETVELARQEIDDLGTGRAVDVSFVNVDHLLIFRVGDEKLSFDLGKSADDMGERQVEIEPEVRIAGAGQLRISGVKIFRDTHYLSRQVPSKEKCRASEGNAFTLGEDEFFVLGDNSPASFDSRWWDKEGIGNNGLKYRMGVVPRDYLVGKAYVVYWSDGFKLFKQLPISFVPNIGEMRFITGGSHKKLF